MRDVLLALILAYFSLRALKYPWIGVMLWTLLSILNPHKYSWQLDSQPIAAVVAVCTLVGILVSKDRKSFPLTRESLMLLLLMAWFSITFLGSFNIEGSYDQWKKVMKIDFMILVTLLVLHTRRHIMALTWVLVFSLGYYGVKGGIFTVITGGQYRVWGPLTTYIEGNNELALALITVIPLMQYLRSQMENRWVQFSGMNPIINTAAVTSAMPAISLPLLRHHRDITIAAIASRAPREWLPNAATEHSSIDSSSV